MKYSNPIDESNYSPLDSLIDDAKTNLELSSLEASRYYATYMDLIQGNSSGKTTLEMSTRKEFFVKYVCLRDKGSTELP